MHIGQGPCFLMCWASRPSDKVKVATFCTKQPLHRAVEQSESQDRSRAGSDAASLHGRGHRRGTNALPRSAGIRFFIQKSRCVALTSMAGSQGLPGSAGRMGGVACTNAAAGQLPSRFLPCTPRQALWGI